VRLKLAYLSSANLSFSNFSFKILQLGSFHFFFQKVLDRSQDLHFGHLQPNSVFKRSTRAGFSVIFGAKKQPKNFTVTRGQVCFGLKPLLHFVRLTERLYKLGLSGCVNPLPPLSGFHMKDN
jgi:hypothetical protein